VIAGRTGTLLGNPVVAELFFLLMCCELKSGDRSSSAGGKVLGFRRHAPYAHRDLDTELLFDDLRDFASLVERTQARAGGVVGRRLIVEKVRPIIVERRSQRVFPTRAYLETRVLEGCALGER
jgi:hypothetical protein